MSHSQLIQINLPTPITIQNIEEAKAPEVQDGKPAQTNNVESFMQTGEDIRTVYRDKEIWSQDE